MQDVKNEYGCETLFSAQVYRKGNQRWNTISAMEGISVVDLHWFQCGSDPTFHLHADPETDPDQGSQNNAGPGGPGSWSDFCVTKSWIFTWKMYLKKVRGQKRTYEGTKAFLKGRKPGLFVNFGQFPCSWIQIRIRISNTDRIQDTLMNADPSGSGSDPDPQHWKESR